jgi:hypothetical protein
MSLRDVYWSPVIWNLDRDVYWLPIIWNLVYLCYEFCARNLNECPFTAEMSIYFHFSKNGHSLCQKNSIGHARFFREFFY